MVDRLIQQALLQVLRPLIDPTFSEHSHGLRPGRSAHGAVLEAQRYVQAGCRTVVGYAKQAARAHLELTGRNRGRSLEQVAQDLRGYVPGWKAYFRLAQTPTVMRDLDDSLRHRLRAARLKQ